MPMDKSIMLTVFLYFSCYSLIQCQMPANSEATGTANLWQYQPNSASPNGSPYGPATHHDYNLGQRQTSLASPLVSFLPMLVLFGIGAVIVISVLYFIFNPFGLTSLLGPLSPGLSGSPSYGRKRSIDGSLVQQYVIELLNTVSKAIEKYDKLDVNGTASKSS